MSLQSSFVFRRRRWIFILALLALLLLAQSHRVRGQDFLAVPMIPKALLPVSIEALCTEPSGEVAWAIENHTAATLDYTWYEVGSSELHFQVALPGENHLVTPAGRDVAFEFVSLAQVIERVVPPPSPCEYLVQVVPQWLGTWPESAQVYIRAASSVDLVELICKVDGCTPLKSSVIFFDDPYLLRVPFPGYGNGTSSDGGYSVYVYVAGIEREDLSGTWSHHLVEATNVPQVEWYVHPVILKLEDLDG